MTQVVNSGKTGSTADLGNHAEVGPSSHFRLQVGVLFNLSGLLFPLCKTGTAHYIGKKSQHILDKPRDVTKFSYHGNRAKAVKQTVTRGPLTPFCRTQKSPVNKLISLVAAILLPPLESGPVSLGPNLIFAVPVFQAIQIFWESLNCKQTISSSSVTQAFIFALN